MEGFSPRIVCGESDLPKAIFGVFSALNRIARESAQKCLKNLDGEPKGRFAVRDIWGPFQGMDTKADLKWLEGFLMRANDGQFADFLTRTLHEEFLGDLYLLFLDKPLEAAKHVVEKREEQALSNAYKRGQVRSWWHRPHLGLEEPEDLDTWRSTIAPLVLERLVRMRALAAGRDRALPGRATRDHRQQLSAESFHRFLEECGLDRADLLVMENDHRVMPLGLWVAERDRDKERSERTYRVNRVLGEFGRALEVVGGFLHHLGPLRDEPKNLYAVQYPAGAWDVGSRGERAIACLRTFGSRLLPDPTVIPEKSGNGYVVERVTLGEAVSRWCQKLGIITSYELDAGGKYGTTFKVSVPDTDAAAGAVDLTNVGVGVSQVLPIVVLCLGAREGSVLLIEQPELHLHPAVQTRLCEMFYRVSQSGRQLILETHSMHIVNGLRLLAARGEATPGEDFAIVFVERDVYGSYVDTVAVRQDGSMESWPRGFFDEAEKVLSQIVTARLEQS